MPEHHLLMDPSPDPYPHLKQLDALVGRGFKSSRTWTFPIIVLGVWALAISTYGWLLGGGFGWIPGLVAGFLFADALKGLIYLAILLALAAAMLVNRDAIYGFARPLFVAALFIAIPIALVVWRREILKEWRNVLPHAWILGFTSIGTLSFVYAVMTWGPIPTFLVIVFIGAIALVIIGWIYRDK